MTTTTTAQPVPAPSTTTTSAAPPRVHRFFTADDFDDNARTMLGHVNQGMIDIGLALATLERIPDGDAVGWYRAWFDTAEQLRSQGLAGHQAGSPVSAAAFFLAASEAYDQALAFVDGMPDDSALLPTFRLHRECWDRFIASSQGRHPPTAVPYEGDTMPGYLFRPDASGPPGRPSWSPTAATDRWPACGRT